MNLRWVAAFLAFLVHNSEELLGDLPSWAAAQGPGGWMALVLPADWFRLVLVVLTATVFVLAVIGTRAPARWTETVLVIFAWVMLANAASHIGLSLLTGTLMPGVVTAIGLIVPVMLWVIATRPSQSP